MLIVKKWSVSAVIDLGESPRKPSGANPRILSVKKSRSAVRLRLLDIIRRTACQMTAGQKGRALKRLT